MIYRLLLSSVLLFFPLCAAAQITTGPVTPIPVNDLWSLALLALVIVGCGWWFLRDNRHRHTLASTLALCLMAGLLWQSPGLRAQLAFVFTSPAGETLPIPATQITDNGDILGFEVADYTNASGVQLRIRSIDLPDFDQCFPGGPTGALLPPGTPDPSPPGGCSAGQMLSEGATCRVDVDTRCRELAAANLATLSLTPTSLLLTMNGPAGEVTVTNSAASPFAANNLNASIPGGSAITLTGDTCGASLAIGASCTFSFVSGVIEGPTLVAIAGDNTNTVNVEITSQSGSTLTAINPSSGTASGGTGVTLTGTGLTGATAITFDGVAATSVNVVNSTTVTAVTPAHAPGVVDVVIDTPAGGATLANGYTYVATAVGQPSGGGTIAALNGGLQNLIAATVDNSTGIVWGGFGTAIGGSAQSNTDGAGNTAAIVAALGIGNYAAQLCNNYEVDSQGNTPCQAGNTCYGDWFLPAIEQLDALYTNRAAVGGFADGFYWSSTEFAADYAWEMYFDAGAQLTTPKDSGERVRCVRAFTP